MTAHTAHAPETGAGAGAASAASPEPPHAAVPATAAPEQKAAPVENGTGTGTGTEAAQQEAATASPANGSAGTERLPATEGMTEQIVLRFRRGTRLQYDRVREQWFIQAPERAFFADPIAAEILQLVNGKRTVGAIINQLCQKFAAPRETIAQDVLRMVQELADKQVLQTA